MLKLFCSLRSFVVVAALFLSTISKAGFSYGPSLAFGKSVYTSDNQSFEHSFDGDFKIGLSLKYDFTHVLLATSVLYGTDGYDNKNISTGDLGEVSFKQLELPFMFYLKTFYHKVHFRFGAGVSANYAFGSLKVESAGNETSFSFEDSFLKTFAFNGLGAVGVDFKVKGLKNFFAIDLRGGVGLSSRFKNDSEHGVARFYDVMLSMFF